MDEIWKPIVGFEDRYEISNIGRVRSPTSVYTVKKDKTGYSIQALRHWGSRKLTPIKVHREVWKAFVEPIDSNQHLDHIDGNRLNNCLWNLRRATVSENHCNRKKSPRNLTSKYKGVCRATYKKYPGYNKPWVVALWKDKKKYHVGHFEKELDAAIAYDLKAIELFGPFARTNIIHTADSIERGQNGSH